MRIPAVSDRPNFVLVDVGAAGGFQKKWGVLGPYLRVIGFEPDSRSFDSLEPKPNVHYINAALGKANDKRVLYLTSKETCSSTFPPNFNFLKNFPDPDRYAVIGEQPFETRALDDVMGEEFAELPSVDFIKLDVHGVEIDVINGSSQTIANGVLGFEIEATFQEIWHGQDKFGDIHSTITKLGFELYDIRTNFWRRTNRRTGQAKGQIIYADALYLCSPERIRDMTHAMSDKSFARAKAINAITCFLIFGYKDDAEAAADYCSDLLSPADRDQIAKAIQPTFAERSIGFLLHRGKLHRIARFLSRITNTNSRQFVTTSGTLGNYEEPH
jgi:FkbM family methyltransferase